MIITFKLLSESDLPLLHSWFHQPHVKQWYARCVYYSFEMIHDKYFPRINNAARIPNFIVYIDDVPIGYIQLYCLRHFLPDGIEDYQHAIFDGFSAEQIAGLDLFIGNVDYLKKAMQRNY